MNSNFHINSFKNFNSDYFCLIPSKYATFGLIPPNKTYSVLSETPSNKDNDIFFTKNCDFNNDKFNFDFNKISPKNQFSNFFSKNNTPLKSDEKKNLNEIFEQKSINLECFNNFKFARKTILNTLNTCLLDLFSESNNICIEAPNKPEKNFTKKLSGNYILKALNEDYILYNKVEDEIPKNKKKESFLEKLNFSPIKKMSYQENLNKPGINMEQNTDKINQNKKEYLPNENNYLNHNNKLCVQSAFKIINNNNYQNPAKIPQFIMAPNFYNSSNMPSNNIQNITNITNVTNNYYFMNNNINNMNNNPYINQPQNQALKKPLNGYNISKKQIIINSSKEKEIPKSKEKNISNNNNNNNSSYGLYQLNQISVNGISISKFPVVSMNEDDLEVQLLSKMLTDTEYFTIVDKYYINIPVLDEEKYKKPLYDKIFKKEKEKISDLYLIGKNLNENNPVNLIRNYYGQIKDKILQIQTNYLTKKEPEINIDLCKELEKLISSCNAITNTVTDYKKSGLKRKVFNEINDNNINDNNNEIYINKENIQNKNKENKDNINDDINYKILLLNKKRTTQKKKHFKTYLCEFCNKAYSNGQGLGGHMSRIHPNQSYKYKDKIRIRREREKKRENLLNIKQDLFKKYGYNYDELFKDKNKGFIQNFLLEHNEEYKNIRKSQQKKEKNKNEFNEYNNNINNKNKNLINTPLNEKVLVKNSENIFSKFKTCDKTDGKFDEKNENDSKNNSDCNNNDIEFEAKIKINFAENK